MRSQGSIIGVLVCVVGVTLRAGAPDLPPSISVDPELRDAVAIMLRESESFRSQIRLLGTKRHVLVRISLAPRPANLPAVRAQCDLARYEYGGITAHVRVWSRADAIELIAHELEHILEFVAGTDYRMLAVLQPGSVWALRDGAFETARAVDAGLRVKREAQPVSAQLRARR